MELNKMNKLAKVLFNKKASADMWWIIIGAVIALVVMIILMVMFTSKTQPLEQGLSSCESKGGVCVADSSTGNSASTVCPVNTLKTSTFDCPQQKVCCLGAPKKCTPTSDDNCNKEKEECDSVLGYCIEKKK